MNSGDVLKTAANVAGTGAEVIGRASQIGISIILFIVVFVLALVAYINFGFIDPLTQQKTNKFFPGNLMFLGIFGAAYILLLPAIDKFAMGITPGTDYVAYASTYSIAKNVF